MKRSRHSGPGGTFDAVRNDQWNQRRSQLNHTDLGNGVLWIWGASPRWDEIAAYITGSEQWDEDSRDEWETASRNWDRLTSEILAHAQRIVEEYRPFQAGEEVLRGCEPHGEYCIAATRRWLASHEKHDCWLVAVALAVSEVDAKHAAVEDTIRRRNAAAETQPITIGEARTQLQLLSESGQRLKSVFSGRGYFNYGESD